MGLIDRLKAALGLEPRESAGTRQSGESSGQDVAVTVEHEPDTTSEDAVKGTETVGSTDQGTDESTTESTEPTAEETSTEPDTDEPGDADEGNSDVEEDSTDESDSETDDDSEAPDDAGEEETAKSAEETETAETEESADVQSIDGIGPAYAERLGDAGIETVADLADADASSVAEESGIAEGRVSTWIERANE